MNIEEKNQKPKFSDSYFIKKKTKVCQKYGLAGKGPATKTDNLIFLSTPHLVE